MALAEYQPTQVSFRVEVLGAYETKFTEYGLTDEDPAFWTVYYGWPYSAWRPKRLTEVGVDDRKVIWGFLKYRDPETGEWKPLGNVTITIEISGPESWRVSGVTTGAGAGEFVYDASGEMTKPGTYTITLKFP